MEAIFYLILVVLAIILSIYVLIGIAYAYLGLSIGMAPVFWVILIIGAVTGFIGAIQNAFEAARAVRAQTKEEK